MTLIRPPHHRGPLLASGAVVLAAGIALVEARFGDDWGRGWHLLITGAAAGLFLWLGLATRPPIGRPAPHQSVLFVLGLLSLAVALLWLARVFGVDLADELPAGTVTWVLLAFGAAALIPAIRDDSAICALFSCVAFGGALLTAVRWISGADDAALYRVLLLLEAIGFVLVSLLLRGSRLRHSVQCVNAAGLCVLAIAIQGLVSGSVGIFGLALGTLPVFWESVVLAAAFGLIAHAAADRVPGPGYLGALLLVAFVALATGADATLTWWPLLLLLVGALMLGAGLRPARPLPPEPDPYPLADLPPHVRAGEREVTLKVREP